MCTLQVRLNDPEYQNWVKAGICLLYTKEGLEDFVNIECQRFHQNVLDNLTRSSIPFTGQPVCAIVINRQRLVNRCHHPYCQAFLNAVMQEGTDPNHPFTPNKGNLANTDVGLWHREPYELAKLFMNPGQLSTQSGPGSTDFSGIVNFMGHCKVPRSQIGNLLLIDEVGKLWISLVNERLGRIEQNNLFIIMKMHYLRRTKRMFSTNMLPRICICNNC